MRAIQPTTDTSRTRAVLPEPEALASADGSEGTAPDVEPSRLWDRLILLVIAGGAALRLYGLARQSMWYDELFTVFAALRDPAEIIRISAGDTSPPLFYLVETVAMRLLGTSEIAFRLVPALAGVLTVWVIYLVGKRLFDSKTAFWASTLFAVGLMPIKYAQEARAYSFLMLFAALGLLTLLRLAEKPGWLNAFLFGLVLVLTAYNHPYGMFGDLALVLCMLAVPSLRRRTRWWGVGAAAAAALLFLPWGLVTLKQAETVGGYVEAGTWHLRAETDVLAEFWGVIENFTPWPYPRALASVMFAFALLAGVNAARTEPGAERPSRHRTPKPPKQPPPVPPEQRAATLPWEQEHYTSAVRAFAGPDTAGSDAGGDGDTPAADGDPEDTPFRLRRLEAVGVLGVTMLLPIVAGIGLSIWVLPIQEQRCFLIGLPAAYLIVALGAVSLERWIGALLLGLLVISAVLGMPNYYTENTKGYYREAVQYLLANNAQRGKVVVSSNFLPLNINVYAIMQGYTKQFDLASIKWWHQGQELDDELAEVLEDRESIYIVTAFVPFTDGEQTAFDDSMERAEGWKLADTRNFDNLPKVEHWVREGSAEDIGAPVAPATPQAQPPDENP